MGLKNNMQVWFGTVQVNFEAIAKICIVLYCVFILSAISPYTSRLKALFNQSDCTGTAPTHK